MTRLTLPALLALASLAPPGPAAAGAPSLGAPSVQGYRQTGPACAAWSDGCVACRAGAKGESLCSTPGIACQPRAVACEAPAAPDREEAAPP